MDLTGEVRLAAPRETVWRALNDPQILKQAIPGCESVEKLSDTEFTAKVVLQIGPMKAKFAGKGTLSELNPPNGYTISGEGQGGVAGFGKGSAKVELSDEGGGTLLRYSAAAQVGGKIAQLGARLIDATAKKLADEFFRNFAAVVTAAHPAEGPAAIPAEVAAEIPATALASGPADTTGRGPAGPAPRLAPAVWIPLLVAAVAVILWFASRS